MPLNMTDSVYSGNNFMCCDAFNEHQSNTTKSIHSCSLTFFYLLLRNVINRNETKWNETCNIDKEYFCTGHIINCYWKCYLTFIR